jgi:hypothetical protein
MSAQSFENRRNEDTVQHTLSLCPAASQTRFYHINIERCSGQLCNFIIKNNNYMTDSVQH